MEYMQPPFWAFHEKSYDNTSHGIALLEIDVGVPWKLLHASKHMVLIIYIWKSRTPRHYKRIDKHMQLLG